MWGKYMERIEYIKEIDVVDVGSIVVVFWYE